MSLVTDIEMLARVSLFEGFPEEQLRLLAFGSDRRRYQIGELIFAEGDLSDGGYIIVSGQVDIVVTREGREIVLSSQLENSLIGEIALITANDRVASAIARTPVEVIYISRELFRRMLNEYPQLAAHLHQRISQSVREMIAELTRVENRLSSISNLATNAEEESREQQTEATADTVGSAGPRSLLRE